MSSPTMSVQQQQQEHQQHQQIIQSVGSENLSTYCINYTKFVYNCLCIFPPEYFNVLNVMLLKDRNSFVYVLSNLK